MKYEVQYFPLANCGCNLCKIIIETTDGESAHTDRYEYV